MGFDRNYFNANELSRHIIVLHFEKIFKEFLESNAITDEEREYCRTAVEATEKFNNSVIDRLGDAYSRKIRGSLEINQARVVSKFAERQEIISYVASEDINCMVEDYRAIKCAGCNRKDFKDCGCYNCCISVNMEGNNNENGDCPFMLPEF